MYTYYLMSYKYMTKIIKILCRRIMADNNFVLLHQ